MKKWEKEIVQKQINDEQKVIWRLRDSYKIAMKDVEEKIQVLQARPQTQSVIYQLKYQQELQKQLENTFSKMSQEWYKDIDSYLKGCYEEGFFETMYSLHNQGIPIILPFNQKEMAQMAAQSDYEGIKLSQKLYDDAIETARISRQEMTRGIANNEDWATIANRISKRGGIAVYNATRIVRTESGRIHSEVRMNTMMKAKDEGADVVKQWDSTVDGRTRSTHIHLDGQLRELEQPFKSPSGATAMYPRGFGVAAEDINCRCEMLQRARWALDKSELDKCVGDLTNATDEQLQTWADKLGVSVDELIKASNGIIEPDGTINHSIKAKNYNDFKKKYKKALEEKESKPKFIPAKTKAEAQTYATKFASNVSYDGLSLENANAINAKLDELFDKYPVKKLEEITKGNKGAMSANYSHLTFNPKKMGKVLEDSHKYFALEQDGIRETIETIKERFKGKSIPPQMRSQVEKLEQNLKFKRYAVSDFYDDKITATVTHEFGHVIADQYFGQINKERANANYALNWQLRKTADNVTTVFNKAIKTGDIYKISKYGLTNSHEFFAECFTMYEYGEKLPDYIEEMLEEILKNGIM